MTNFNLLLVRRTEMATDKAPCPACWLVFQNLSVKVDVAPMHGNCSDYFRLCSRDIPIHDVTKHAPNRETFRVLFSDKSDHTFHDIGCGKRIPLKQLSLGDVSNVQAFTLVSKVFLLVLIQERRHVDFPLTIRCTTRRISSWFILKFQPVQQPSHSRFLAQNVYEIESYCVFMRLIGQDADTSGPY